MTSIRVASFNAHQHSNDRRALAAVRAVMEECDVLGLQEFGGRERVRALRELRAEGWDFYKPTDVSATVPAIAWRTSRFALVRARAPRVAAGRAVLPVPGRRAHLPDLFGNVVILRDTLAGRRIAVGNLHAPAHVEFWPGPRRRMYREAVRDLARAVVADDRPAFITGDWNWDLTSRHALPVRLLREHGLHPMWRGHTPARGTHGNRVIDGVFSTQPCTRARVLGHIDVGDHKPVIGTFTL